MTIQLKELKAKKDPFDINQITAKDLSNEMNESIQKMTNMKNHKKISISSTHGVGKTTLINLIKKIYKKYFNLYIVLLKFVKKYKRK